MHVSDFREINKTQGSSLLIKGRVGDAGPFEFDDSYAIKKSGREMRREPSFLVLREKRRGVEIALALPAQIGRNQADRFEDAVLDRKSVV